MTSPAVTVLCERCRSVVFEGGRIEETPEGGMIRDVPFGDGQIPLTEFADTQCPIGGTAAGCPNTTEARQAEDDRAPVTRGDLRQLRTRVEVLEQRRPDTP